MTKSTAKPTPRPATFTVVLTGGIAAGKTAVSDQFARLGVPVIDTDRISRDMVEPGQPALQRISREFGTAYLDESGRLDRRKMRHAIFTNDRLKSRLESILHPLIAQEVLRQVRAVVYPYCILVVPLYVESARWQWVDRILVVDVSEPDQVDRVMMRDGVSREQAEAVMATQASREQRLAIADDVIDNTATLENLKPQVEKLHRTYLALAIQVSTEA